MVFYCNCIAGASVGWLTTSQHFGALASTALAAWLLTFNTWRVCLVYFGLVGLAISIFTLVWLPSQGKIAGEKDSSNIEDPLAPLTLQELWKLPGVVEVTISHLLFKFVRWVLL